METCLFNLPKSISPTITLFSLFLLWVKAALCRKAQVRGSMAKPPKKNVFLFYCAECEELAHKVAAQSDSITLQTIKWRSIPFLSSEMQISLLSSPPRCLFPTGSLFLLISASVCTFEICGFCVAWQFLTIVLFLFFQSVFWLAWKCNDHLMLEILFIIS